MTELRAELRVEVRKLGNRYQAITRAGDGHEVVRHEFQYDTASLVRGSMAWVPDQTGDNEHAEGDQDPVQVAAQGEQLYRNLFDNGRRLREHLSIQGGVRPSHLTLSFDPPAALLARLPWEVLYDGSAYLALSGNLPVSHRPYGLRPLRRGAASSPLRILLVIAAPEDQGKFDVEHEIAILQEALDEAIRAGAVCLDVLPEPTSAALLEATQSCNYHVLHYVGHGVFQLPEREGFLCLEDGMRRTELVGGEQFPHLPTSSLPSLIVLAAYPRLQYGVSDAFAGVAQDLLRHDIPAVLSVPAGLAAAPAAAFYRTLYASLAKSETVVESVYRSRLALSQPAPDAGQQFGWAVPVLYQRDPDLRLVEAGERPAGEDTTQPAATGLEQASTTLPIIGRKSELYSLRVAIKEGGRVFYIWGSDGVGKHSFTSHVIQHLPTRTAPTLLVTCREGTEPLAVLGQIADFWRLGGTEADEEAAQLLLDARQDPARRARQAQKLLETRRLVLCFENIDRWFVTAGRGETRLVSPVLANILLGLVSVPSKSLFFFTGTRRWDELLHAESQDLRELYLPLLSVPWSVQVMNRLPSLMPTTLAQKHNVYWHVGGHPRSLELLAGLLSLGQDLDALLQAPPVVERSTGLWEAYLIDEILNALDPGELQVLRSLALLAQPFSATTISQLTPVTPQYARPLVEKWRGLGLFKSAVYESAGPTLTYDFYLPVRDAILRRISSGEMGERHLQAAAYYAAPFIDGARRQVLSRNIAGWTDDRVEWLARDTNGILGTWLRQQSEPGARQALLERALGWQQHLFEAGRTEATTQVVQAIVPELKRQGQRDLAEALLQRTIKIPLQTGYATGVDQLSQLQVEEGPLTAALDVYQQVYESLDAEMADLQRAHVLMRAAMVQVRLGDPEEAIRSLLKALQLMRREGNKEGVADCLYRLAKLHRETGDIRHALVYSQAAREHYEGFDSPSGLAAVEQEQGLILKEMGHLENALECFATGLRICRKLGDMQGITANLTEVGMILDKLGRHEVAIRVIEEALQHYEYLRSPEHSEILSLLEGMYAHKQRLDEAVARLRTARQAASTETKPS